MQPGKVARPETVVADLFKKGFMLIQLGEAAGLSFAANGVIIEKSVGKLVPARASRSIVWVKFCCLPIRGERTSGRKAHFIFERWQAAAVRNRQVNCG
jgi:hypothetical protein